MGNYNREYEKYYKKINKKHKTSPMQSNNKSSSIRKVNKSRKKNNESIGKHMASDILLSSIISGCIFFSFFVVKGVNVGFGEDLCNKFKTIISTDGYYKELALQDSVIVGAISKSFEDTGANFNKSEERDKAKVNNDKEKVISDELNKESKNSSDIFVESFNDFNVVEKTALDFLKDSKVVAFKGEVASLKDSQFEKPYVYISGEVGEVKSILKGKVKDIREEGGMYSISLEYNEELEILYHNLSKVNKEKGDSIKENEVLGESSKNSSLNGIVIQVIADGEYINPKEYLDFLGVKDSEIR